MSRCLLNAWANATCIYATISLLLILACRLLHPLTALCCTLLISYSLWTSARAQPHRPPSASPSSSVPPRTQPGLPILSPPTRTTLRR
ncbi:hypothetical protein C8Q70DRAFT_520774 [Cubamyces menziesii]|nr:hypothetical protein C8Q70DRAFT_520774 [Cubamyces menziesii]